VFVQPTPAQRAILKLLAGIAPHAPEYTRQVEVCVVRGANEQDDLEISVPSDGLVVIEDIEKAGLISEAVYRDADGQPISLMLHVANGKLYWLEHYKPLPLPIVKKWPDVEQLVPGPKDLRWDELLRERGL